MGADFRLVVEEVLLLVDLLVDLTTLRRERVRRHARDERIQGIRAADDGEERDDGEGGEPLARDARAVGRGGDAVGRGGRFLVLFVFASSSRAVRRVAGRVFPRRVFARRGDFVRSQERVDRSHSPRLLLGFLQLAAPRRRRGRFRLVDRGRRRRRGVFARNRDVAGVFARARDAHRGAVDARVTVPREYRIDSRSFVAMSASRALRRVVAGASNASRRAREASAVADAAPRVGGGEGRESTSSSIPASRWRRGARARGARDGTTSSRCAPMPSYLESKRRRAAVAAAIARSTRAAAAAAARRARAWDATARADARDGAYCDDGARRVEKFSRVGVLGAPNAGKSALACALVGDAVSAVSRKTNTTRTRALGVRTVGDAQVVFVDAPGIVGREHYRNAAHARKVEDATALASECDALVFVVDAARQLERRDLRVLEAVRKTRAALGEMRAPPEAVLVLNKVDKIPKERRAGLTKMVDDFRAAGDFEFARVFPVSALTGAGTRALMDHIVAGAREAPWEFDATSTSDMTPAQRALEIVRESVYDGVHEDLPYGIDIAHVSWEDFRNGDARIEQNILVDTASQRKIVVGKSGEVVGRIGINARAMLERALNRKVHLILNVRLKKKKKNYRSDDVVFAEQY